MKELESIESKDGRHLIEPPLSQLITDNFPRDGLSLVLGYGSKVIKQSCNDLSTNDMIDLIIAVDNPYEWHQENLMRNPHHYSFLKYLPNSVSNIVNLQERFGSQVYYNPFAKSDGYNLKYGVIKTNHLIDDLCRWTHLYVAGRLHKPVKYVVDTSDANKALKSAIAFNKESALRAAMLLLPETFSPIELYKKITGLSYMGDFRMMFGEDKYKVDRIVTSQIEQFDSLYMQIIRRKESVHWNEGKKVFTQDLSPGALVKNLEGLPKAVRLSICKDHSKAARSIESHIVLSSVARSIDCDKIVARAISSIVKRSSLSQSLKGLITAGLSKSINYSCRKLVKSLKSRIN